MSESLIYLSNCALHENGSPDPFLLQELPWLLKRFDRVQMVSYYGVATLANANEIPAVRRPACATLRAFIKTPFAPDLWREARRLRQDGKLTLVNLFKLAAFTQRGIKMHLWTEALLKETGAANTTLYSCWLSFDAYAAALSKRRHPEVRFVARGHAYDVDIDRTPLNPYLMKQRIADEADGLYLISQTAKAQLMAYMQGRIATEKVHVLAMGSSGEPLASVPQAPRQADGILHVVSCAMLLPIKQVDVLIRALARWEGAPLCWTHIGGGEGEAALRALAEELLDRKENVIYHFMGTMDSAALQALYDEQSFDVFVNTSRKEGVPVSIMEAMRHGIPTIAPRVGGIPEMVTQETGILYAPEQAEDGVLSALERFSALPAETVERMRRAAKARWDETYCSMALLPQLFPENGDRK